MLKDTNLITDERFEESRRYNFQKEYLEMCIKYMALAYDFIFFSCRIPVVLWNYFNVKINDWGWCASEENY